MTLHVKSRSFKAIAAIIAVVAVVVFCAIYSAFDPSSCRLFPKCFFYQLTGYKCPGCGSQRALHALLHGNVLQAVRFNAALVAGIPLLFIYGYGEATRTRHPRFYKAITRPAVLIALLAAILLWWVLRNIFNV